MCFGFVFSNWALFPQDDVQSKINDTGLKSGSGTEKRKTPENLNSAWLLFCVGQVESIW